MTKAETNKLDRFTREASRARADFCEFCGKQPNKLDAHHYVGRRNRACRWVLMNIFMLCSGCHFKVHQNPIWGRDRAISVRGAGWETRMRNLSNKINKFSFDANLQMLSMTLDEVLGCYGVDTHPGKC